MTASSPWLLPQSSQSNADRAQRYPVPLPRAAIHAVLLLLYPPESDVVRLYFPQPIAAHHTGTASLDRHPGRRVMH
ncbi:unnamed protein product [Boreogadus saida]